MIANSHARSVEIGTAASDLPTPAVLVDLVRLEANLGSWQAAVTSSGARFRPHVKTRKVVETAARQIELGACGIASAKVSEAEVFVAAGIRDVVIAYPVLGADKCERVAQMAARGTAVSVNVDSELGAEGLSAAAVEARHAASGVQLEVDTGLNRVGFRTNDETDRLESLARIGDDQSLSAPVGPDRVDRSAPRFGACEHDLLAVRRPSRFAVECVAREGGSTGRSGGRRAGS